MVGKRSYGKLMGTHRRSSSISKIRTSERTKLLEQGIALKKRLDKKGPNLSNKDMEDALKFSKKVDQFNAESAKCSSCGGKVTPEQFAYRKKAHPGERMLCTGCAMSY